MRGYRFSGSRRDAPGVTPPHANCVRSGQWAGCALLLSLPLLVACAETRYVLHYGVADDSRPAMTWPADGETPRYRYAGQLTGEANLRVAEHDGRSSWARFLHWVAGLPADNDEPRVLQRPIAVTADERGRVYVSDVSRQAVFVFDEIEGKLHVWEMAEAFTRFAAPVGLSPGADGELLVVDAQLGMVVRLDRTGNPVGHFGRGTLKRPTGLARDPLRGRVYVADTYDHNIKVFGDDGRLIRVLGRRGEGPGEFNFPTHVFYAHDRIYVADTLNSRVQVLRDDGTVVAAFGRRGLYVGNLVRPKGVATDGEGNIYVVESYHDTLLTFSGKGELLMAIGGTGQGIGQFYLPVGVWVDRRDRVLVADTYNGRIVIFQFLGGG